MKENDDTTKKTTVSLVLGSGGARGLAHIGVIRWLEEHHYEIKSVVGCSIGSLIGGLYVAGKLDELENWILSINKLDIANLLDLSWGKGGFIRGDKIIHKVIDLLGDIEIENLPIPFTAVAADIITEKEVWINKGMLINAIRASISLPLFFSPVRYKGRLLIDGGVLNPVPIAPTFTDDTDLTIAVNLGGDLIIDHTNQLDKEGENKGRTNFQQDIKRFIQAFNKAHKKRRTKNWGMYEIADKAFDTMQSTIARLKIASYPPDIDIEIARNACGILEFDRAAEMIQLGYDKAKLTFEKNGEIPDSKDSHTPGYA